MVRFSDFIPVAVCIKRKASNTITLTTRNTYHITNYITHVTTLAPSSRLACSQHIPHTSLRTEDALVLTSNTSHTKPKVNLISNSHPPRLVQNLTPNLYFITHHSPHCSPAVSCTSSSTPAILWLMCL